MPRTPDVEPQTPEDWVDEAAKQDEIATQVNPDAAPPAPKIAGSESGEDTDAKQIVEERPKVTIRPVQDADIEYPLTLSVVGAPEEGFVFESDSDTIDVDPQVAEQITYLPNVEVAE